MAPTSSDASAVPPTVPTLSQRQSCDRCHKQKLRCTRENNGTGGGCDRCLRRRTQCVYSFSLPKGRPSLYRQETTNSANAEKLQQQQAQQQAAAAEADEEAEAIKRKQSDASSTASNQTTSEHNILTELLDTTIDMTNISFPQVDTLSWEDMQLEVDWSSYDPSYIDSVFASLDNTGSDGSSGETGQTAGTVPLSQPPNYNDPQVYSQVQAGAEIFEKYDTTNKQDLEVTMTEVTGTIDLSTEAYMNYPSLVIAELSQLSMRLSSLRYSTHNLAKAADSSSSRHPDGRQMPLIDAAAFEAVASWLAHDHCDNNQVPILEGKPKEGHGILHEIFSASHNLLEILRHLQLNSLIEPSNGTATISNSVQSIECFELAKGLNGGGQPNGNQQHHNHTVSIIRHLIMACEALLLEIYVAILITLQHDAYPNAASMHTTALGDLRLVMVVQLCSYLIERQDQAVDLCLSPLTSSDPLNINGNGPLSQKLQLSGREVLSDLKNQVQQRLTHLRQLLNCT